MYTNVLSLKQGFLTGRKFQKVLYIRTGLLNLGCKVLSRGTQNVSKVTLNQL